MLVDCAPFYPPHIGGLESFASDLHRELHKAHPELEIRVVTSAQGAEPGTEHPRTNLEIHRYPAFEPVPSFAVPRRARVLRRLPVGKGDTVVTHTRFFVATWLAGRRARRTGATWIHFEHGGTAVRSGGLHVRAIAGLWDITLGRWILRHADHLLVLSDASHAFVRQLAHVDAEVLRCGITAPDPAWHEHAGDRRAVVVFLGRLIDAKGCVELLEAHAKLQPRPLLRLIGDGPERERLQQLAARLGTADDVTFVGPLDKAGIEREFRAAHAFVSPSHTEGLGLAIVEAAAMGLPIVATRAGGTLDTVVHEETGLLVDIGDIDQLAAGLQRVLDDRVLAARLGDRARHRTAQLFSWSTFVDRFMSYVAR